MELLDLIKDFGDAALSMALMGYWVYRQQKVIDDKNAEIRELNNYIRESDKEDIKTLNEFSRFLESLIAKMDVMQDALRRDIAESARSIKSHINERIGKTGG